MQWTSVSADNANMRPSERTGDAFEISKTDHRSAGRVGERLGEMVALWHDFTVPWWDVHAFAHRSESGPLDMKGAKLSTVSAGTLTAGRNLGECYAWQARLQPALEAVKVVTAFGHREYRGLEGYSVVSLGNRGRSPCECSSKSDVSGSSS